MNKRDSVIRRLIRAWYMPATHSKTARRWTSAGLVLLVVLVVALSSIGAEAVPLAFQSPFGTPTPTPSPTPTFDPNLFPTVTPSFDPNLFPTSTPTFDPNLFPTVTPTFDPNLFPTSTPTVEMMLPPDAIPTAAIPLPPGGVTDSVSSVVESPSQGRPAAPEILPLLPRPDPGAVPPAAAKATNPANEARQFGQTIMAALTYVWMGCGVMLLLLAGMAFLWLNRRSRLR